MSVRTDKKNAIVVGAARGIGAAVVSRLRSDGMMVWAADRDSQGDNTIRWVDITDSASVDSLISRFTVEQGPLDVCVANAGVLVLGEVADTSDEMWKGTLAVNLTGTFFTLRAAARQMILQGIGGSLIVTVSIAGLRGEGGAGAYTASKFGLIGLIQCLAQEVGPHGIRVNGVCPGDVQTTMHESVISGFADLEGVNVEAVERALQSRIPLRRVATTDDIVGVYSFLASDDSRYVTGATIVADGGQLLAWTPLV